MKTTNHSGRDDFLENYEKGDVAEAYCRDRLEWYGFDVIKIGIDKRDSDPGIYDDKPDFEVQLDGKTLGYVESKAKSSEDWLGIINERMFSDYCYGGDDDHDDPFEGAKNLDVPVWIFMALINEDRELIEREFVIPVEGTTQIDRRFTAPDGHTVVVFDDEWWLDWSVMIQDFLGLIDE